MKKISPAISLSSDYVLNERFSDDFKGKTLDSTKWAPLCPTFTERDGIFYFDEKNVSVRDGLLRLTARIPSPDEIPLRYRLSGTTAFCTAFVHSMSRIRYGYFETRARGMNACVCNAFWLHDPLDRPAKGKPGDFSEEIDMFEFFGKNPKYDADKNGKHAYFMTVHKVLTPYVEAKASGGVESSGETAWLPFEFWKDFHVYSFLWTEETLQWFVDGNLLRELPNTYHKRAMYLNFDCEVMRAWTGDPDPADLPAEFDVDYVRVWQRA